MNYLLSASILLLAVWPAYYLLLRYSERYTLNRLLLLLGLTAVCALPFVSFSSPAPAVTERLQGTITYLENEVLAAPEKLVSEAPVAAYEEEDKETSEALSPAVGSNLLPLIYCLGLGLLTLVLGFRLLLLLVLHLRSRPNDAQGYRLLHPSAGLGQAFTFGRSVYFSTDVPANSDFNHVLSHERIHARQMHSLDILLGEFFLCIFWFHPVAWWLRSKMRANLEFLVDKKVVTEGADRRSYQLALVRQSQMAQGLALALPFSEPSLKSRIVRMTGMPEYRLVGIIAAVALLFWLGTAAVVINGQKDESMLNWENAQPILRTAGGGPTATEFLYAVHVSQAMPDEIDAFELYFRRLPTPGEYLQLKAIMGHFPHTNFNIYEPCNGTPGSYVMQLSHYLKQEAVFRISLREGELLPNHFVFSLEKRTTSQPIPDDLPLDSYGYYQPTIGTTAFDFTDTNNGQEEPDSIRDRYCTGVAPRSGEYFVAGHESFTKEDELAVFINGERFNLLPEPDVKFENGMQFAGYAEKGAWSGVEGKETDPNKLPNSLRGVPSLTAVPPNARMACLLGMEGDTKGMVRTAMESISSKSYLKGALSVLAPQDDKTPYRMDETLLYLNDKRTTKEALLKIDFPQRAYLQTGRNSNIKDGPTIIQVITDSGWR